MGVNATSGAARDTCSTGKGLPDAGLGDRIGVVTLRVPPNRITRRHRLNRSSLLMHSKSLLASSAVGDAGRNTERQPLALPVRVGVSGRLVVAAFDGCFQASKPPSGQSWTGSGLLCAVDMKRVAVSQGSHRFHGGKTLAAQKCFAKQDFSDFPGGGTSRREVPEIWQFELESCFQVCSKSWHILG